MVLLLGSLNLLLLTLEEVASVCFEDFLGCAFFFAVFAFCFGATFFSLAVDLGFIVATEGVQGLHFCHFHSLTMSLFLEQNQDLWQQHQLDL